MRPTRRWITIVAGGLLTFGLAFDAKAYNEETHQRMVAVAVEAMVDAPNAPVPPGVNPEAWANYTARLALSVERLRKLRSMLPPVPKEALPINDPDICSYHSSTVPGRELNLLHAPNMRIDEVVYFPKWVRVPCALEPLSNFEPAFEGSLGPVLGWHAQSVDSRVDDSVLWLRPTNSLVFSTTKELANRVVEFGLGAVLAPFVCLANLIAGADCDPQDSFDLTTQLNPVTYIEGMLPGGGDLRSTDFVGLWHFIDVEASTNRYNDVRGMLYEGAGPSYPGAVDLVLMAASDVAGLSLNAYASAGPKRYGAFDRLERTTGQWQAHSLGHTEFSPIDNLAHGDWEAYVKGGTEADLLGGPLHAVGDAAAPHHVTGTTSWGHRPFEDAMNDAREELLPVRASGPLRFGAFRDRVLRTGFDALRSFDADPSIRALITREARATRQIARGDGDWVFQDGASVEYHTGALAASQRDYKNNLDRSRPLIELGVAYTIALLGRAGDFARDPGHDPQTLCPPNTHYSGVGTGCDNGPAQPPLFGPFPAGISFASCLPTGSECKLSIECCGDAPCIGGTCTPRATHCPADLVVDGNTAALDGMRVATAGSVGGDSCPNEFWGQITQPQRIFERGGEHIEVILGVDKDSECERVHTLFVERQRIDGTFAAESPIAVLGRLQCGVPPLGCSCVGLPTRTLLSNESGNDTSSIWVGTASHPQVNMSLSFRSYGGPK